MSSNAAGNAADAQTQAARDAINAQLAMYNQNRSDNLGRIQGGNAAYNMLLSMYGLPTYTPDYGGSAGGITVSGGQTTDKYDRGGSNILDPKGFINALRGKDGRGAQVSAWIHGPLGGAAPDPLLDSMLGGKNTSPMQFNLSGSGNGTTTPGTGRADFSQFYQTPDYLVARDEGLRGLQNSANDWNPGGFGGRLDMDRMKFASNLGSKAFGDFKNTLFGLAGIGGQANSQVGAAGSNFANQVSNQYSNMGNANASGYLNQGAAWNNALNGVGTAFGQYWGNRGS